MKKKLVITVGLAAASLLLPAKISAQTPFGGTPAAIPGTIQNENYDTGGQGVAYNVTSINGQDPAYRSDGVDLENTADAGGGDDLGWTSAGQWFKYTVNVATAGTYTVSLRVASATAVGTNAGSLHLQTPSGTNLSGAINVPGTGGWQTWTTITATVTLPAGQQVIELFQDTGGYNLNYMTFASPGIAPVISSPGTASGTVGSAFSYQIAASHSPTSYGASGLPAGLSVNASTGLISGTPTTAGTSSVTLSATNASGTGNQALTLTVTQQAANPWELVGAADFNGDGKPDLIWQNTVSGQRAIWLMNGTTYVSSVSLGTVTTDWDIAGAADFNGDGKPDLIWQNTKNGQRAIWLMNGTTYVSSVSLGTVTTDWQIAGAADFNKNGNSDLIWQNTKNGQRAIWLMNGTTYVSSVSLGTVTTDWQIVGAADLNGDGNSDLIWQNTVSGQRAIWLMNGTTYVSTVSLGTVTTNWNLVGAADFNGDGKPDLIWQDTASNQYAFWLMNGTTYVSSSVFTLGLPQLSAPSFNPAGGTYTSAQNVTISDATSSVSIRYTTDGSTPSETNGTLYSGPVNIGNTTTLKAIAYANGYIDSPIASATYTITTSLSVGATTPFVTYEGEAGTLGGGATVSSLTSPPTTQYSSLELEASGHAYVKLTGTGQSVQWTNNTGQQISFINVRECIPNASNGGGITATLDLYVNGVFRQALNLNSKQTWIYEGNNNYQGNSHNPTDGDPHVFFDEAHTFITGAPIAPGSTFSLKTDSSNTAAFYYIDAIDVENPPAPYTQPANSLSITSYGAVADNNPTNGTGDSGAVDSTAAIQNCINAAQSQGKSVWIPAGTFYLKGTAGLNAQGITIEGAGMWYSTIYRAVPLPNNSGLGAVFGVTSCTLRNFHIDSNATSRAGVDGDGGAMDTTGTNWVADSMWNQHVESSIWASGTGGTVKNCRFTCIWADGCNLNNVSLGATVGNNLTATNNFIRGTGDDGMAINSVAYNTNSDGSKTFYTAMSNIKMTNNSVIAVWGGKGLGIYGGSGHLVQNNYISDTGRYIGLGVGRFGVNGSDLLNSTVTGNVVVRAGGNGFNQGQPALQIGNGGDGQNVGIVDGNKVTGNTIINSLYDGIGFSTSTNTTLQQNTVTSPGRNGIVIAPPFFPAPSGSAIITGNTVTGVQSGNVAFINNSGGFNATVSNNSWQGGSTPVSAPTFNPGGGSYTSAQSVTIGDSTSGASIRYTTDGSTPSETVGTLYSGPVSISATTTLNAIAYAGGFTDSTVASAAYTISLAGSVAPPTSLVATGMTDTTVSLSWTASTTTNAIGYNIYKNGTTMVGTTASAPFTVTGLTAGSTYNFTVTAFNGAADESAPSNTVSVTTPVNLSLNKPITANSTSFGSPTLANDGVVGQSSYWQGGGGTSTLTVDLGSLQSVNHVVIVLPPAWQSRTQTFSILGSTDNATFFNLVGSATYQFSPQSSNTVSISFAPATVRYVRLSFTANTGSPGGQVSEIQVFGGQPSFALNCPISANGSLFPANLANDGVVGQNSYWQGAIGYPNSLTVDLGSSILVNSIDLKLPPAWAARTQTFSVQGSADNVTFSTILPSAVYNFDPASSNILSLYFPPVNARYVKLVFTANSAATAGQVSELEVYGSESIFDATPVTVLSWQYGSGALTVTTSGGILKLTPFLDQALHVQFGTASNIAAATSYAVTRSPDAIVATPSENSSTIFLTTSMYSVQVNKTTSHISVYDAAGKLLVQEAATGARGSFNQSTVQVADNFQLTSNEALYGLGEFRDGAMNLRGISRDLFQVNTQSAIPVVLSTNGWSMFWDNPSETAFSDSSSGMSFNSSFGNVISFYVVVGSHLDDLVHGYRRITGSVPMLPRWAMGYHQSRNRYDSQPTLLSVAAKMRTDNIPMDTIFIDYMYWGGNGCGSNIFDTSAWPNVPSMLQTLHNQDTKVILSVWPCFASGNANYNTMNNAGYLLNGASESQGIPYDVFNPAARTQYWNQIKTSLVPLGIDGWFLDGPEPEFGFGTSTSFVGSPLAVANAYPLLHISNFYEGLLAAEPNKRAYIITRCSWAGQQRNGMTIWSGDITGSFAELALQVDAGLNYTASGLPYWTTDIGGYNGGATTDPAYQELFTRWWEWGTFCPIFRSHGVRQNGTSNELWNYGPTVQANCTNFSNLRYRLIPYIYSLTGLISQNDYTPMRLLAFDFASDPNVLNIKDEFMYGPAFLINPVTVAGATSRSVYLPAGSSWIDFWTGATLAGGQTLFAPAPINYIPIYARAGSIVPMAASVAQSTEQIADGTQEIRIYPGANGSFSLYADDNTTLNYQAGAFATIPFTWNESTQVLTIGTRQGSFTGMPSSYTFKIVWVRNNGTGAGINPSTPDATVTYTGGQLTVPRPAGAF